MISSEEAVGDGRRPSPIIGWVASSNYHADEVDILEYCTRIGAFSYGFVLYPAGGMVRNSWKPQRNEKPPRIDLADAQLNSGTWSSYVMLRASDWIDCDSPEPWVADISCEELDKELSYASYLPVRIFTITLKNRDSPRLANILTKWLWTRNISYAIWVFVPTIESSLSAPCEGDDRDIWSIWADFRNLCTNYSTIKFGVGLHFGPDIADEFVERRLLRRWHSEPVAAFWFESSIFINNVGECRCTLPQAHARLFGDLFTTINQRPMIVASTDEINDNLVERYYFSLKNLMDKKIAISEELAKTDGKNALNVLFEHLTHRDYVDSVQIPLQPLTEDLDSVTYSVFEEDSVKYDLYRTAINRAIEDLVGIIGSSHRLAVYLLGAGRGPLMQMIIEAEQLYNAKSQNRKNSLNLLLYAVEKNVNANVTLRYKNTSIWNNRVKIIEADMRELRKLIQVGEFPQPDLIVSELLGSFGDNELCPECLDSVTDVLRETTISIPQRYTSYAAPIQSPYLYQKILSCGSAKYYDRGCPGRGRLQPERQPDGTYATEYHSEVTVTDEIYVVCMRTVLELSNALPVFTFKHPNFERLPNSRSSVVTFDIKIPSELMGFAGYFDVELYGDCRLSILPNSCTRGLVSWFPALVPLRKLYRLQRGSKVVLHIERKSDEGGVWYEWFVEIEGPDGRIERTELQNKDGMSYYMRM